MGWGRRVYWQLIVQVKIFLNKCFLSKESMYNPLIFTMLFSVKLKPCFLIFGCHDNRKAAAMATRKES